MARKWDKEEVEALSFSDLPINSIEEIDSNEQVNQKPKSKEETFDFGTWNGSILKDSEMCAADDLFFQGQILPLRLSTSSDNGFTGLHSDRWNHVLRLESMFSSRSSSSGSSSNSSNTKTYKVKLRNRFQFHSYPSPKPRVRQPHLRMNFGHRYHNSSIWDLFRLGLVRAPGIESHDLKVQNWKSEKKETMVRKKGLMGDCKCSVETVETNAMRGKNGEMGKKNKGKRQDLSLLRTFEWLKELSHPNLSQ